MLYNKTQENQPSRLPARLDCKATASLLGFEAHDIPVLMQNKLLKPLGNPSQQCRKYFALVDVVQKSEDTTWLSRATNVVMGHWKQKNDKKKHQLPAVETTTTE